MKETLENDLEFSEEIFKETYNNIKKKKSSKYEDIIKAGPSLLNALYKLYEVVWNGEKKPDE